VEVYEFRSIGWKNYFTQAENLVDASQLIIIFLTLGISMELMWVVDTVEDDTPELKTLRDLQTFGVLIANI